MAKSTAHQDALGAYENFKAPWESEAGADAEIDKGKLKRLIFNLKLDHAKARDSRDDADAALKVAETERDEARDQAADGSGAEAQKKIDKLTADLQKVTDERDVLKKDKEVAETRKEVLGDFEAKYPKAAKYVTGETEEELTASLKEVAEDWGIDLEATGDEDEVDEDEDEDEDTDLDRVARTKPRGPSLLNPRDPANGKGGEQEIDFDKVAGDIVTGGAVFR